ncbi:MULTISPECIES: hypothetical protein [Bacillus]|uniref:hypothetical protein n=1 Tax=Bacillus TaxID=1386 RepID=UPI000B51D07A|nr:MULTISPECIES: hypothetical protein [Bacillus]MBL3613232.1 hypothetical protein [Bacillus sp. RHFS18]ASF27858.1 hypothetical protein WV34_03315 [Bacillus amyloliquefaciens]MBM7030624.1 hypothetical protein [Bacillus velezensis]MCX2823857.1 hypothetical protein [Bacillus sp. H1F1]MDY7906718.1 hypothetical protein [Bacillus sp. AG1]
MRKIYNHMNVDQKKTAIKLFKEDLEELKKEQKQESEKGYPRVVRDAIEETIQRYIQDIEYLTNDLKQNEQA